MLKQIEYHMKQKTIHNNLHLIIVEVHNKKYSNNFGLNFLDLIVKQNFMTANSVTYFSAFSNPAAAQNASCL